MQEKLDTELFGLRWNDFLAEERPTGEDENNADRDYRGNRSNFHHYPDLKGIPPIYAQLLAQRSNAVWDHRQRRRYAIIAGVATILTFAFGVWVGRKMTTSSYLLFVALPAAPAYVQGLEAALEQLQVSTRRKRLYETIQRVIELDLNGIRPVSDTDVRDAQDMLFVLRCRPGNVPQLLYKRLRPGYRDDMEKGTAGWKERILETQAKRS
jgi:hypothetical protein